MDLLFIVLLVVLVASAVLYWWFFMKKKSGNNKVDIKDDASAPNMGESEVVNTVVSKEPVSPAVEDDGGSESTESS